MKIPLSLSGDSAGHRTNSSGEVFPPRNWLQVFGVDAGTNTAGVIKIQSVRDAAHKFLIGGNVCRDSWAAMSAGGQVSISLGVDCSGPEPASRVGLGQYLFHESFNQWAAFWSPWHAVILRHLRKWSKG
jgi:hypothetical protein